MVLVLLPVVLWLQAFTAATGQKQTVTPPQSGEWAQSSGSAVGLWRTALRTAGCAGRGLDVPLTVGRACACPCYQPADLSYWFSVVVRMCSLSFSATEATTPARGIEAGASVADGLPEKRPSKTTGRPTCCCWFGFSRGIQSLWRTSEQCYPPGLSFAWETVDPSIETGHRQSSLPARAVGLQQGRVVELV